MEMINIPKHVICILSFVLAIIVILTLLLLNILHTADILGEDLDNIYQSALKNNEDVVPDEETAIAIAKAILETKYGKIERKLKVDFYDKLDLWVVWGESEFSTNQISPERTEISVTLGAEPYVFIHKKDGRTNIVVYK